MIHYNEKINWRLYNEHGPELRKRINRCNTPEEMLETIQAWFNDIEARSNTADATTVMAMALAYYAYDYQQIPNEITVPIK